MGLDMVSLNKGLLGAFAISFSLTPTFAAAADIVAGFRFVKNDPCMRVSSFSAGVLLETSYCGNTNASFVFKLNADSSYTISPANSPNLCLQQNGMNAAVSFQACSALVSQKWLAITKENKRAMLQSYYKSGCLTAPADYKTSAAVLGPCGTSLTNQLFANAGGLKDSVVAAAPAASPTIAPSPSPSPSPSVSPTPSPITSSIVPNSKWYAPGAVKLLNGQKLTLVGASLVFTAAGDLQVINSAGKILWNTKTAASCSTCSAIFQNDGNLVIYGSGGAVWSSATYNNNTGRLFFSNQVPYLSIANNVYKTIWTSGGFDPAVVVASSVQSFISTMGVNSHMDQYESNATILAGKLKYLGINQIRDHYSESLKSNYQYLANQGVRFDMIDYSTDIATLITHAKTLATTAPGALMSVEGLNEINNFPFSFNGSVWKGGWPNNNGAAAAAYQTAFYSALKAQSGLKDVSMYNLTGNTSAINAASYGLLSLDNMADFGNIHPYAKNGVQPYVYNLKELASVYTNVSPMHAAITETGYTTAEVTPEVQAILLLNTYLSAFKSGFHKCYVYLLTDNAWEAYGFFDRSGNPKPSAVAVHNLTSILADTGTVANSASLGYALTGLPATAHHILLQKSNGSFALIVWNEPPLWANGQKLSIAATTVKVTLPKTFAKVSVFNPVDSLNAVASFATKSSLDIQLSDRPLIIELKP
jgi:hypothetical protein